MDKRSRSKSKSRIRSRSKKRVKRETVSRFYHSAHGSLSTSKEHTNDEIPSTFGYPETHFVNGEKKTEQIYPIKLEKDVSGVKATIYFKINSDMCTSTKTSDNSKAESEGEVMDNLAKFHTLFTIEVEGKGNELIIKKVLVHSPSTVDGMTPEQHVDHIVWQDPLKYKSTSQPPEVFYDGKMMTRNIPNLEFFYEADFNTGFCAINSDNMTERIGTGKLWWRTEMMKINKVTDKPVGAWAPATWVMDETDKYSTGSKSSNRPTLKEIFSSLDLSDKYEEIINDFNITLHPSDYDEEGTKVQLDIMKYELVDYLKEVSKIYFHHPDPHKSLLSAVLTKAPFRSKPGDNLSVTIFNSTCLVNQMRDVADHDVFTENPIEDRMRYPDFYRLYEGPMDRSILLRMRELSRDVRMANREIDSNLESISIRETWIQEDKELIKKYPSLPHDKVTGSTASGLNDKIRENESEIDEFKKNITEQRTKIKQSEKMINVAKKQQKAQRIAKTLDTPFLQPGTRRKGQLKKKKKKKKKKGSKRRRRSKYTRRR